MKYYLYHYYSPECRFLIRILYSEKELIQFIAYASPNCTTIPYLDGQNLNADDFHLVYSHELHEWCCRRGYLCLDENGRHVCLHVYEQQIIKEILNPTYDLWKFRKCVAKKEVSYRYRHDPVPQTGKKRCKQIPFRHFKNVGGTLRKISAGYLKKRKIFPNIYENNEYYACGYGDIIGTLKNKHEKSWKRQTKCKHQWEKNLK